MLLRHGISQKEVTLFLAPPLSSPPSAAGTRILLVEDDVPIATLMVETLGDNGFQALAVGTAEAMDHALREEDFALIILDIMLPGEDGFSICRRLRAKTQVPIVMVTALGEDIDTILGLELGADDYVTKPFNPRELVARVRAILRHAAPPSDGADAQGVLEFAGWRINAVTRQLHDPEGVEISLTTTEFDVLLAFCRNPNRVLTREAILALTHAGAAGPDARSIDVHVSRLRQKVEPNVKDPSFIKTIRLGGYLFTPTVRSR